MLNRLLVAQLQVPHIQFVGQLDRAVDQRRRRVRIFGDNSG